MQDATPATLQVLMHNVITACRGVEGSSPSPPTVDSSCPQTFFFLGWCATHQQVLDVILEHHNDEQPTQHNGLGNDVLVGKTRQEHPNEDVGNAEGQG